MHVDTAVSNQQYSMLTSRDLITVGVNAPFSCRQNIKQQFYNFSEATKMVNLN